MTLYENIKGLLENGDYESVGHIISITDPDLLTDDNLKSLISCIAPYSADIPLISIFIESINERPGEENDF